MPESRKKGHDEQISVRISSEMLKALDKHAEDMGGVLRTNLIRMAIQDWLIKREKDQKKKV